MSRTRLEEFTRDGKNFIYIDLSDIKKNEEFQEMFEIIKPIIEKYPEHSLYTITNIENIRYDSESKKLMVDYLEHNKPFVKFGAVIGLDGINKLMVTMSLKLSGRNDLVFAFTREQAVELLLKK
jgi:hypothetical protein